ncbi:RagB/SusD family nutrient uptake outer membrane protein [Roseisolibacter agri]|uniref:Membrane protein n=1 Tax=Roseisolibacter agri TaxID=2014610 RepID=A0AA37V047_9BACT|nr:RagB/SusD family nutrient uptake outer membrane protein [Roseisolibacter agri]GLC23710.1 membrane protein [Roseisolibacter agri]
MLKRAITLLGAAAALLGAAACNDEAFLTEVPYDFVGPENFYATADDARAALAGVYATSVSSTGDNYYGRNFVMLVEFLTEMQTPYLSATNERSLVDNYTFTPAHSYIYSTWQSAYQAINRANSVIDRVPAIPMDTTLRSRLVAEAKFLRALHYFNLVRMFGGVPLRTKETTTLDSLQQPRASAQAVYAQIVTDLKDAIRVLPAQRTYTGPDIGRASRGAAKTLLAKAYLQRAGTGVTPNVGVDSALALLQDVKATEGYALVANYASLFDMTNEVNSEVIFDVQCSRSNGVGCRLSNQVAPRMSNYGSGQNGSFTAEEPFFLEFAANDRRLATTWQLSFTNKAGATITYGPTTNTANGAYGADTPYMAKFLDRLSVTAGNDEPNYIILRYADNLLMEAEAINELQGPTAAAYAAINAVRTRAGLADLTAGLAKAAFKDSVFAQRRLELSMEGPHGYFDSQRNWAWAKARIEANFARGVQWLTLPAAQRVRQSRWPKFATGTTAVPVLTDKYRLLPIPTQARDLNPQLEQNPGW